MENCELCAAQFEPRIVKENKNAFAVICKWPLKDEHVIELPRKCTTDLRELSSDEAKDFLTLLEEIKKRVKEVSGIDVIMTQNSGKHSTEPHVHYHVVPSKGSTRKLISTYEDIPERADRPEKEWEDLAKRLR